MQLLKPFVHSEVSETNQTTHYLYVPAHPEDLLGGGNIEVVFQNADNVCPPIMLTVQPLPDPQDPAVKGSFAAAIDAQLAALHQEAQELGIDPTSLKQDF